MQGRRTVRYFINCCVIFVNEMHKLCHQLGRVFDLEQQDLTRHVVAWCQIEALVELRATSSFLKKLSDEELPRRRKSLAFPSSSLLTFSQLCLLERLRLDVLPMAIRYTQHGFGIKHAIILHALRFPQTAIFVHPGDDLKKYIKEAKKLNLLHEDPMTSPMLIPDRYKQSHYQHFTRCLAKALLLTNKIVLLPLTPLITTVAGPKNLLPITDNAYVISDNIPVPKIPVNLRIIRDAGSPVNTFVVIRKQACFHLKPIPIWGEITCNFTDHSGALREILSERRGHQKICDGPWNVNPTSSRHKFVGGAKDLAASKRKPRILVTTGIPKKYNVQADAVVIIGFGYANREKILPVIDHIDATRNYYNLYILCTPSDLMFWEYTRIQSYRPWQESFRGGWILDSPPLEHMEIVVAKCDTLHHPADKCIVSCHAAYFRKYPEMCDQLRKWWETYRGCNITSTFDELLSLAEE